MSRHASFPNCLEAGSVGFERRIGRRKAANGVYCVSENEKIERPQRIRTLGFSWVGELWMGIGFCN
jgi:hypothetical protein